MALRGVSFTTSDGVEYKWQTMLTKTALSVQGDLTEIFGGALGELVGAFATGSLNTDIDLSQAFRSLGKDARERFHALGKDLLPHLVKTVVKDDGSEDVIKVNIETEFSGDIGTFFELAECSITENYRSFWVWAKKKMDVMEAIKKSNEAKDPAKS